MRNLYIKHPLTEARADSVLIKDSNIIEQFLNSDNKGISRLLVNGNGKGNPNPKPDPLDDNSNPKFGMDTYMDGSLRDLTREKKVKSKKTE